MLLCRMLLFLGDLEIVDIRFVLMHSLWCLALEGWPNQFDVLVPAWAYGLIYCAEIHLFGLPMF